MPSGSKPSDGIGCGDRFGSKQAKAMRVTIAILALLIVSPAFAVDQVMIDAYALRSKSERPKAIAAAKASIVTIRQSDEDKIEKRGDLKRAGDYLKSLQDKRTPFYPEADFDLSAPEVGRIGMCDLHLKIIQVVDDNNSIVDYESWRSVPSGVATDDPRTFGRVATNKTYWLTNVSTKQFASGEYTDQHGVFALMSPKTYQTAAGSHTLMVLEYVDLKPQEEKFMGR